MNLWAKGSPPPVSVKKVLWNSVMYIYLHIVYGCFYTAGAYLSSCNGDVWPAKFEIFTLWPFTEKSLPTACLKHLAYKKHGNV